MGSGMAAPNWTPPLVGRTTALDQMEQIFNKATAGRAQIALLVGPAGIGKSRLLKEVLEIGAKKGFVSLVTKCDRQTQGVFFLPLQELIYGVYSPASLEIKREVVRKTFAKFRQELENRYVSICDFIHLPHHSHRSLSLYSELLQSFGKNRLLRLSPKHYGEYSVLDLQFRELWNEWQVSGSYDMEIEINRVLDRLDQLALQYTNRTLTQLIDGHTLHRTFSRCYVHDIQKAQVALSDSKATRAAFFSALSTVIIETSRLGPLILAIDDVHWADGHTIEFLAFLNQRLTSQAVMVVCTFRTDSLSAGSRPGEWRTGLRTSDNSTEIQVEPLRQDETEEIIRHIFPTISLHEEDITLLHRRSEGNPFFLVELLKCLEGQKTIYWTEGQGWDILTPLSLQTLPTSVQAALTIGLRYLPRSTLRILEKAAVIGKDFPFDLWKEVTGQDDASLVQIFENLSKKGILIETAKDMLVDWQLKVFAGEYCSFTHGLRQETVYNQISSLRRKKIHRQVAVALQALKRNGLPIQLAQMVGYHLRQAGDLELALPYLLSAAIHQQFLGGEIDLKQRFEEILSILENMKFPQVLRTVEMLSRISLADIERAEGQLDKAEKGYLLCLSDKFTAGETAISSILTDLTKAIKEATVAEHEVLKDVLPSYHHLRSRAFAGLARIDQIRSQCEDAVRHLEQALNSAQEVDDFATELQIRRMMGWVYVDSGQWNDARQQMQKCLGIIDERSMFVPSIENRILGDLGRLQNLRGDLDDSLKTFTRAITLSEKLGDEPAKAIQLNNLGEVYRRLGAWTEAKHCYNESRSIALKVNDAFTASFPLANLAKLACLQGDVEESVRLSTDFIEFCEARGYRYGRGVGFMIRATARLFQGRTEDALKDIYFALVTLRQAKMPHGLGRCFRRLGIIHFRNGDFSRSRFAFMKAVRLFRTVGDRYNEFFALCNLAELEFERNAFDQCHELVDMLLEDKHLMSFRQVYARILLLQARLYLRDGNTDRVQPLIDFALSVGSSFNEKVYAELLSQANNKILPLMDTPILEMHKNNK